MIDIKAIDFGIEDLGSNTDFDNYPMGLWSNYFNSQSPFP